MQNRASNPEGDALPAWAPYEPTEQMPWSLARVVHLHRRAGFATTWREIERDLSDAPQEAVTRLLRGESRMEGVPEGFSQFAEAIGDAAVASDTPERLQAWWLYRMLFTPDPLSERLVLMWHNHFATSNAKVEDVGLMRQQNDTMRTLGRAPYSELLRAMMRDPALLIWLDAPLNRKGGANENLGRELLELFTLGIGNYSELDVKEASRALTGWSASQREFRRKPHLHDDGEKIILGQRGQWDAEDLVRMLLEHPATARRLAERLCGHFMGEDAVDDKSLEALAAGLRHHNLDIAWGVETILRSRAFFADLGTRVVGPAEFIVGAVRALELFDPPPSTITLAEWMGRLGQELFYPPNVGGWDGGRRWLSTRTLIARTNFAHALVMGELASPTDLQGLLDRHVCGAGLDEALRFFHQLLLGGGGGDSFHQRLMNAVAELNAPVPDRLGAGVALILASPEAQVS